MTDARPKCDCPSGTLSPSQIDTFRKCQRRWGFRKLALRQEPETTSQQAGKEIHDRLEKYALTGALPHLESDKYAKPVWAAVGHLPAPHDGHRCEQHIRLNLLGNVVIHGYPDLVPFPGSMPERTVVDYKTVSVRKKRFEFALTAEQLKADTQGLVYAQALTGALGNTQLKWIYIERQPPYGVHVVDVMLSSRELRDGMAQVAETAHQMYARRAEVERLWAHSGSEMVDDYVNSMPANTDHCGAYGGCPHAGVCTAYRPPAFFPESAMSSKLSLQDLIAQRDNQPKSSTDDRIQQQADMITERLNRVARQNGKSADVETPPDIINSPIEAGDDDDDGEEIRQLEAQMAARKKAARQAREAKAKAQAQAQAAAERQTAKIDLPKAEPTDVMAENQESAEPATPTTPAHNGFSIEIRAIALGNTLGKAVASLKQNVANL